MTDVRAYLSYFQTIASEHISINDYFVLDINEPLSALRGDIKYPALIMNSITGALNAQNLDNILDDVQAGFLIIGQLANVDDFSGEMILFQQMKQIGLDIISRMNHDLIRCQPRAQKAIWGFHLNSVAYDMVDGIFDNCFGFSFTFRLFSGVNCDYNSLLWQTGAPEIGRFPY